ncbi:MAG TPA: ATP-binding protein [Pyrinomonadaceae bacterium]|jgi:serine/threonine-protein kinase RsbW
MEKRRILIVESDAEFRRRLEEVLYALGHEVIAIDNRDEAVERDDLEDFDIIISDLTDDAEPDTQITNEGKRKRLFTPIGASPVATHPNGTVKAFKLGVTNFVRRPFDREALRDIVEKILSHKLRFADTASAIPGLHEKIEFELPSDISLMNGVLHYLNEHVARLGVIRPDRSNLFIALDEAFVNAVKHGNKNDPNKLVRITADLSQSEARFTIEDEGDGFNVNEIPDPLDPANLFKTSGRGVLLIYNIMDEVEYNERGNRLTMVKRPEESLDARTADALDAELIKTLTSDDISAANN